MILNLGSGDDRHPSEVNIDIDPGTEPDLVCDISQGLPFPDNSIQAVIAKDVLEHVPNERRSATIDEIWRVLEDGGEFVHMTPSTDGRGAFQDPTHLSFWNIKSLFYYCPQLVGGRRFYNIKAQFSAKFLRDTPPDTTGVIHTQGIMHAIKGKQNESNSDNCSCC